MADLEESCDLTFHIVRVFVRGLVRVLKQAYMKLVQVGSGMSSFRKARYLFGVQIVPEY